MISKLAMMSLPVETVLNLEASRLINKLNFNEHVDNICKKANNKLQALARIAKYLSPDKLRIIMKTFIESQFNYCPLTWMFHSRQLNSKINKLQERALRIVHKNPNLTFQQLLNLDKTHCIHHGNLQKLAVEMFKVSKKLVPAPIQELVSLCLCESFIIILNVVLISVLSLLISLIVIFHLYLRHYYFLYTKGK